MTATCVGRRRLRAMLAILAVLSVLAACSGSGHGGRRTGAGKPAAQTRTVVRATLAPWRLPNPVARIVAISDGTSVVLAGGLTTGGVSSSGVYRVDVANGSLSAAGQLAQPVHDAAGALIGGNTFVFGGGAQSTVNAIQRVGSSGHGTIAGRLPQPRSDLSVATLAGRVIVLGGYTGSSQTATILATSDGTHLTAIGTLPVTVRYGATVSDGQHVWVFGGQHGSTPTDAIQRIDPSGTAKVVGHLPSPLTEASALDVGGMLLVAGGRHSSNSTSDVVYAFDPHSGKVSVVAHLPVPVADAGATVLGGTGYLFGGENSTQVTDVQQLTVSRVTVTATTASPSASSSSAGAPPPPFTGQLLIADRGNNRLVVVDAGKHILWRFPTASMPAPPSGFYFPDDAFFIHGGTGIISNQEGNDTIVEIGYPSGRPLWSYGHPRVASAAAGYLNQPDDSYLLADGRVVVADATNCRIVVIGANGRQQSQIGTSGSCTHHPPNSLGYPNGDTPLKNGNVLISEVHGSWISEYTLTGHLVWTCQLPIAYPSDPQQIGPDRYLVADYARPGGLFEFNRAGQILWSYRPVAGYDMLNHPSLAEILPSGLIAVNDDYRDRVVLIDPATKRIVWQYGITDKPGRRDGYLNTPDGFDLLAPDHSTPTHPFTG